MAEDEDGNGESEESSERSEESDDSFIDNEEVVAKKSNFFESKLLEIEQNKNKIFSYIESLPEDEYAKLGLVFCYSNKTDIFK